MHPLYADVVRRALPTRRSAAHARRLVDAHAGASETADAVLQFRLMIWRVDAGRSYAARDAVDGAWRALNAHDAKLAIRITSRGHGHVLRLPRSSRSSGKRCASSAGLRTPSRSSAAWPNSREASRPMTRPSRSMPSRTPRTLFGLGRIDEAYDVLRHTGSTHVEAGELRAELVAHLSVFDTFCGRLGAAVADVEEFLVVPSGRGFLEATTAAVPHARDHRPGERDAAEIAHRAFSRAHGDRRRRRAWRRPRSIW